MESKKCFKLCNLSLDNVIICEIMELYAKYLSIFTSFDVSPALDYTKFTLEDIVGVVVGCLRRQKSMTLAHIATSTLVAKKPNW